MSLENTINQTLSAEEGALYSQNVPTATPLLVPPPRPEEESSGSTPSATSEANDTEEKADEAWGGTDAETREINAEEIPDQADESSDSSYDSSPAQFASHIFFQKGLHGGNGVNFTLTRRKGRQYIQVSQAEDESVPLDFFRECLDHASGVQDDTEALEAKRQNEFTDMAIGSCATGAAVGMFFLLWLYYIISGAVQIHSHKC
jgi:hypothetical protein